MIRSLRGPGGALALRREPGPARQVTHENVCRVHDLGSPLRAPPEHGVSEVDTLAGSSRAREPSAADAPDRRPGVFWSRGNPFRGIVHRDLNRRISRATATAGWWSWTGLARPVDSGDRAWSSRRLTSLRARAHQRCALTASADVYALASSSTMLTGKRPPGDDQRPLALRGDAAVIPPPSSHEPDVPGDLTPSPRGASGTPPSGPRSRFGGAEKPALEEARLVSCDARRDRRDFCAERRSRGGRRAAVIASALAAGLPAAPGLRASHLFHLKSTA
jgi:hypothetical protein